MKKRLITYYLLTLGLVISTQFVSRGLMTVVQKNSVLVASAYHAVEEEDLNFYLPSAKYPLKENNQVSVKQQINEATVVAVNTSAPKQETKPSASLSRGGTGLSKTQEKAAVKLTPKEQTAKKAAVSSKSVENRATTYSGGVQLLDWWKSAQYIFSNGTVAEVTDLQTGRSFTVKRTMGTNHADSEALTKKDTDIIKSIWGGFSWDRRPVILTIGGKKYAASMSAMPHAGLDSAPAYTVVNNRSEGFGRGENLDVIKGNGMDGHFDIHFLNSTRHKDGQEDPLHQAAVLKAAGK